MVSATVEGHTSNSRRTLDRTVLDKPRLGVIVGASRRYEGVVTGGYNYSSSWEDPPEYEGNHLETTRTVMVWLVRFGMVNKAEAVLDEDLTPASIYEDLPIYANACPWDERARKIWSEGAKAQLRDSRGRFITQSKVSVTHVPAV